MGKVLGAVVSSAMCTMKGFNLLSYVDSKQ